MIRVDCYINIYKDHFCFLDPLKTQLLQEIIQCGSLNKAAKKLNISYQNAWQTIEDMNQSAPSPLVTKQRGGLHGGGMELTTYGQKILKDYTVIENQVKKVISQINVEINL